MTDATSTPTRRCPYCGEVKPIRGGFYQNKGKRPQCRACNRLQVVERLKAVTEWIDAYKMERGCADCGWCVHPHALEFDHRPGEVKLGHVSKLRHRASIELIAAEVQKCDVVCANCHRLRTVRRGDAAKGAGWDLRRREPVRLDLADLVDGEPTLLSLLESI